MARLLYGGSGADLVAAVGAGDGDYEPSTATFNVYTERACTNQHTALQNLAGGAISTVVPDANGRILFNGVDNYVGDYYLRDVAQPTSEPWLIRPAALTTRVQALEGTSASHYVLPGTGIPLSTLDTSTQGLINGAIPKGVVDVKGDLVVATGSDLVARLPVGINGNVLIADSTAGGGTTGLRWGATPTAIPTTLIDAKGDLIVGTANDAASRVAVGLTDGHVLSVQAATTSGVGWGPVPTDASKANVSGSVRQFADVSDTVPTDDTVPLWDTNQYVPTNLDSRYASADPSTGKLLDTELPPYTMTGVVVDSGANPPPNTPIGAVVLRRQAAASLIPTFIDDGFAQAGPTVTVTAASGFAVGEWFGLSIGSSGEATAPYEVPNFYNVSFSQGAATEVKVANEALQSGTSQSDMHFYKVTTTIPVNATITVTCRNTANTANQTKPHLLASLFRLPNIASPAPLSDVLDQNIAGSGANSTVMDKSVTTAGATSQAACLALEVAVINSGTGVDVRVASPTNSWQQLSLTTSTAAAAGRQMMVAYKVLTTVQTITGNLHIQGVVGTTTENSSGGWTLLVAAVKGA